MTYYNDLSNYVQKEILNMYPPILTCNIHKLPKNLGYTIEFIFKVREDLSENQISVYYDTIDYKLFNYFESNKIKCNYIIILSKI